MRRTFFIAIIIAIGLILGTVLSWADINKGLISYWPFNNNLNDETGHGYAGEMINGTISYIQGVKGNAIKLPGTTDSRINIVPWIPVNSSLTISGWVKILNLNELWRGYMAPIYNSQDGSYSHGFFLKTITRLNDLRIEFGIEAENHTGNMIFYTLDPIEFFGKWHHMVGVVDRENNEIRLYYDGQLRASSALTTGAVYPSKSFIGSYDYLSAIDGATRFVSPSHRLDEIRLYNRALTGDEIQELLSDTDVLPTVTTYSISSIMSNSATCGGNVTLDGGATVTARGVCWSTTINPTIVNSKTTDGSGTGSFTSTITGLSASTPYYVRAYATNSKGTAYGANINFTTGSGSTIPAVTTNSVSTITSTSAICGGNVISEGGTTVTAKGVCWNTATNPTISNSKTSDGTGTGSFTSTITGLIANTPYYVRAYATNSKGTAYGLCISFTTGSSGNAIPASERAALIALYNSTNGDNWTNNSGWKDTPLYEDGFSMPGTEGWWFGIGINTGHVRYIEIYEANNLAGNIPSQLGNLSGLVWLILSGQKLTGSIPFQLANLSNLTILELHKNQLSGSIPSQLGNLSKLESLRLSYNRLSGTIPSSLKNLKNIDLPGTWHNLTIGYNCLSTTDSALITWLNSHDPDWEAHQDQCGSTLPEANPPFGSFATPNDGITVAGSIAVTGWALDDSGVATVKIYRTQGYIGDALFVEGARPDVAIAYPEYPSNTRAGWGYMLLTNFLPDGPITLTAIATDLVGKTTELGSKTFTIDNAHAVKPFGAIDTPTQGGTATGKSFLNWGWALTPQPNIIPTNSSTISVWVNGVNKGHPTYNNYREDIASLFPGYANSNGAVGYFYLDTTKYTNAVHTIQWTATDNAGNTDGIGSRYFTIQNTSSDMAQSTATPSTKLNLQQISALPEDSSEPIYFSTGFHGENECSELLPDEKGNHPLTINELERVEIQLGQNYTAIQGYLISGNQLNPLPIGSTLDAKRGIFSWSPGPGFIGNYSLVFVLTDSNGLSLKKAIEIKIEPKFNK